MPRFLTMPSRGVGLLFITVLVGRVKFALGHDTRVMLTPDKEEVRYQSENNRWGSDYNEKELIYRSNNPETLSYITFDLSQADFFDHFQHDSRKHFVDATLKLYSLDGVPKDVKFDVVLENERDNRIEYEKINYSDCRGSGSDRCWIELDITKELLWSVDEQRTSNNWNPSKGADLIIRISASSNVEGAFASRRYDGGKAPKLTLDFTDDGSAISQYSSGLKKKNIRGSKKNPRGNNNSNKKRRHRHKVKVVKGKRKNNKSRNKRKNSRGTRWWIRRRKSKLA